MNDPWKEFQDFQETSGFAQVQKVSKKKWQSGHKTNRLLGSSSYSR